MVIFFSTSKNKFRQFSIHGIIFFVVEKTWSYFFRRREKTDVNSRRSLLIFSSIFPSQYLCNGTTQKRQILTMSTRHNDLPSVWISRKNVEKWLRYDRSKFVKNDNKFMAKKWSIFLDGEKFIHQNFRRRKFHETKWKSDEKNVDTVEKNTVENNSGENNTKFLVRLT